MIKKDKQIYNLENKCKDTEIVKSIQNKENKELLLKSSSVLVLKIKNHKVTRVLNTEASNLFINTFLAEKLKLVFKTVSLSSYSITDNR